MKKILIVDDEPAMRMALREVLRRGGYDVVEADGGSAALDLLEKEGEVEMVLSDVRMPEMTGTELLKIVAGKHPGLPFVIMTAFGTVEDAVDAMRNGARDYILKPFTGDAIIDVIEKIFQSSTSGDNEADEETFETGDDSDDGLSGLVDGGDLVSKRCTRPIYGSGRLVFADPCMNEVISVLDEVSDSHATVLLEGESGTGKEILARYLHQKSPRRQESFVAVNCAALPEGLLESELFGHEKGSFTGAIQSRKGKFELANGGTILLDEISEMPMSLQAKLLRVLQEHEIDPVGARAPISIDIRVVATTNRDLAAHVRNGHFREDLYYRLNVINLHVPSLRQRPGDMLPLVDHFLRKHCKRNHRPLKRFGREMIEYIHSQKWPGNVRELENFVERAVLLCKDMEITPQRIFLKGPMGAMGSPLADRQGVGVNRPAPLEVKPAPVEMPASAAPSEGPSLSVSAANVNAMSAATHGPDASPTLGAEEFVTLEEMERRLILSTLEKVGGNRTRAADMLGVSVRTIRNKLAQYRDDAPESNGAS